ncbi:MAG TPA: amidohydrolase family protein [Longimicrobiaceae bacterium]|nr:amidohydrolase family protein [Longimicrobiaceae bacterium]
MLTLIENGQVYAPEPLGRQSVLLADSKIAKVGPVDRGALERLGVEHEVVDAAGCIVAPGLIDPHQHLLGGSGEEGFSTQTPEFFISEIVQWGITTVVGSLGVDTTMKTMPGLLAKAKALAEEGLNAYIWTGGYNVPPTSIMQTIRDDIMFIAEVIGAGEIAISDRRGMNPPVSEIARVVTDSYIGGILSKKAGVTHFHVGESDRRLAPLRDLLENYDVEPQWLYVTHIERSEALMREAVDLVGKGVVVDIDTVEEDLPRWLRFYLDHGGDPERLTVSSDASISSPRVLYEQICRCVVQHGFPLELALSLVTRNTARILKLQEKGTVEKGKMGDLVVLRQGSLDIVHVLSRGEFMVRDGSLVRTEKFLEGSNRSVRLEGKKGSEEG